MCEKATHTAFIEGKKRSVRVTVENVVDQMWASKEGNRKRKVV